MASTGVNRPTNVQQKEQDVNQKLQLYGIFTAFSNGKVPSNAQIDVAMNSLLASRALASPSTRLSAEGRDLVADVRDVVEKAKTLLLTKNEGNLLQDFIWQTQNISGGNVDTPNAPVDKETAKQHGNQALEGLRTLGTLILSNGQFRKLLSDATVLLRDMAGDAAQTAANKVNPSQDQLSQIDRPAPDNTWHDTPDFSASNLKEQASNFLDKNSPLSRKDLQDVAGDATQTAHPSGSRNPQDAAELAARDQQQGGSSGVDAQAGAQAGINSLKDKVSANTSDETKDRVKNAAQSTKDRTRNYLSSKMPEDRRNQTIWRLKKMVVEIQGHPDYQQAIDTLLSLAEEYAGHSQNLAQQTAGTVKGAHTGDSALTTAETDLKTLIERFANSTSSDDLIESINNIYRDADADPELKKWFRQLDQYVRKCLKENGYILEDRATEEWNQIYDHGNYLLRERYRDHTDRVMDEFNFMVEQFNEDRHNRALADSLQKLFTDLGRDQNGKPAFKPHLIKDLTNVIIPAAFENISYVPIPRIEYTDSTVDAIVENLIIESDNLFPNMIEVANDNRYRLGRKTVASSMKNKAMVAVSGVQMDLKDVSYYIRKKTGFPTITDKGIMDIYLGGTGFSFRLGLETADAKDRQHFFKINTISVDIKNLRLHMKQSNHKLLFNLFKPLLLAVVKPALTKIIEMEIRKYFNQADQFAYDVSQEARSAAQRAADDPESAGSMYQDYLQAFQRKLAAGKQKTAEVAADKKANVAMTQHDSMFRDIKLPGGISTKATEYREAAAKGDKWESPVFSIGSAAATTNLPSPERVTRKPHNAAAGGIRGAKNLEHGSPAGITHAGGASGREGYNPNALAGNNGAATTTANNDVYASNSNYGSANSGYDNQTTKTPATYRAGEPMSTYKAGVNGTTTQAATQGNTVGTTLGTSNPVLSGSA